MSQDKKARLLEAAAKAKAEIDAQLNRFMEKLDKASDDPSQFIPELFKFRHVCTRNCI